MAKKQYIIRPWYSLVSTIIDAARWNLQISQAYRFSLDTATRWNRGRSQLSIALEILEGIPPSNHIQAYYLGAGSRCDLQAQAEIVGNEELLSQCRTLKSRYSLP